MSELDGLDGWERLDPALRAVATTRTNFSPVAIRLMREPFNQRRREAPHGPTRRAYKSSTTTWPPNPVA
jgi:hypothetical protein